MEISVEEKNFKNETRLPQHIAQLLRNIFEGRIFDPPQREVTRNEFFLNKTQDLINTHLTRYKSSSSDNFSSNNKRFCQFSLEIGLNSPVFSENWTRSCRTIKYLPTSFFYLVPHQKLLWCIGISVEEKNSKMRLAYPSTLRNYYATFWGSFWGYFRPPGEGSDSSRFFFWIKHKVSSIRF